MKPLLLVTALVAVSACTKGATPAVSPSVQAAAAGDTTVVATYAGKKVTLGELDASITKELYQVRRKALETMVMRDLLKAEAAKVNKGEEDFLRELEDKLAPAVTDAEVQQIYDANKDAFEGRSLEEIKPVIVSQMKQEKAKEGMIAFFEKMRSDAQVKIMLSEPRIPVAAVGPARGPADAPVTIVEFSDFQCPFCSTARKTADQVLGAFAGKVRLVFRDYPLPFHDKAKKAAEAGQCANEQGKFWEMHDWMFEHQDKLEVAQLKEGAKGLGIDAAKFDACLDSGKHAKTVQDSIEAGQKVGVNGTPAFFINGKLLSGAQPFETFKDSVEAELAAK